MTDITVRLLAVKDDRTAFVCGDENLDRFFRRFAGQNQFKHHIGVTYVATNGAAICGFVTVSPASIEIEDLPSKTLKKLPHYPLPVLRLARLATSIEARSEGVGLLLLRFALQLARDMSATLGCVGVLVDAKAEAVPFYERYGFEAIDALQGESNARPVPQLMFQPVGRIP